MRRRLTGASLIEVMVAIVLLAFGLLSLMGLQGFSVAAGKSAANRGIAAMLASDLADMIRANTAAPGSYDLAPAFDANAIAPTTWPTALDWCTTADCSPTRVAEIDKEAFTRRVKGNLQAGTYALATDASREFADLWIMWSEPRGAGEAAFDNCPTAVIAATPAILPRCLYVRVGL